MEQKTKRLEEFEKKAKTLENQRKTQQKEIDGLKTDKNALLLRLKTMGNPVKIEDLDTINKLNLKIEEKTTKLSEISKEKDQIFKQNAELLKNIENLKTEISQKDQKITKLCDKIKHLEKQNEELCRKYNEKINEKPKKQQIEFSENLQNINIINGSKKSIKNTRFLGEERVLILKKPKIDQISQFSIKEESPNSNKDCHYFLRSRTIQIDDKENNRHINN